MTDKLSNHLCSRWSTSQKHEEVAVSTIPYYPVPGSPEQMTGLLVPVQIAVAPPARQRRVTVFFRLLMVIPHYFVLSFLGIAALVVAFIGWWGALFTGQLPEFAADFLRATTGGTRASRPTSCC